MYGPHIENCAGIRVKKDADEAEKRQFTRVGLSTRVRKHVQEHKSRVIRHFLEDQATGNLDEASLADSVNLYRQKRQMKNGDLSGDDTDNESDRRPMVPGRNSPSNFVLTHVRTRVGFADDTDENEDDEDEEEETIRRYKINFLPELTA